MQELKAMLILVAVLLLKRIIKIILLRVFKIDIDLIIDKMLKREMKALTALQEELEFLRKDIINPNTSTSETNLDLTIDRNLDLLVTLIVRLVDREKLKLWHKIAFAIVVQFLKKIIENKKG